MLSRMSKNSSSRVIVWWLVVLAGAFLALLVAWAARIVRVPTATLLTVAVAVVALSWLVVLVTVPWNLYFAARRASQEMAVSRDRGITVRPDTPPGTRPAITSPASSCWRPRSGLPLPTSSTCASGSRCSRGRACTPAMTSSRWERMGEVSALAQHSADDLHRTQAMLVDKIEHTRNLLSADLSRLSDTQEADRAQAQARHDDLKRQIDQMIRRIEATLDGISDHQELLTGLRALVRMVRSEPI